MKTYRAAAEQNDEESLHPSSHTNHPSETNKQNNAKDILDGWQKHSEHCSQLSSL